MKVYVASRFKNYEEVRKVIDKVEAAGHTITFDWTRTSEFDPDTGELLVQDPESELTDEEKLDFAISDTWGAEQCDVLILVWTPDMAGAFVEMGMAMANGNPILVIGPIERWTIFYAHPLVTVCEDLDDAMGALYILNQHTDASGS